MLPGMRGRLVTGSFARDVLPTMPGAEPMPPSVRRALEAYWRRCDATLGPAVSVRTVADVALMPLLRLLGFEADGDQRAQPGFVHVTCTPGSVVALAAPWNEPLARGWRSAVVRAIARDADWCLCCNGTSLRIVDARRTWSREYLEFDLQVLSDEPAAQEVLWSVARAGAMAERPSVLDRAVRLSARHGTEVCRALGIGVLDALRLLLGALARQGRATYTPELLFEHCLTVLYRVLFLLFAEARGLVPMWHPLYRDRYSLDHIVSLLADGRRYRGLWQALRAISRLAHAGCSAGALRVNAFNGRLFSPSHAPAFDGTRIDDDVLGQAVVAVSTTSPRLNARVRIAFRDLDVEQLGAVYEQVLDYEPAAGRAAPLARTGDRRKATGTFYTPRAVTSWLVRRTLEPLLAGRTSDEMLRLRILDPAMGSGAFLVSACRYLAAAIEDAFVREGRWQAHDVTAADRALLRREVAARCLFGVDVNPMAVQLARLSIWLATLAADRPLSFLDHHLVSGDSLVGATPDDIRRQPGGGGKRTGRTGVLPLFQETEIAVTLRDSARVRLRLAADADDSAAVVRSKERTLSTLRQRDGALGRWSRVLDLWCAGWFWDGGAPPDRATFGALVDRLLHDRCVLPESAVAPRLAQAEATAARGRFLHWPLEFPEVFVDVNGDPLPDPGFDAIVGNPPWDMVRGDSGEGATRGGRRDDARRLTGFVRESGVYRVETRAHANRYQLFVERALQLARRGGRIGLVLPAGIAFDTGAAPLRRHLFDRADVDGIIGLDNRQAIFPIHRSVRFVLMTATSGRPTTEVRCRFGISQPQELEREMAPLLLTRRFLSRVSGDDDLGIPELGGSVDLRIVEQITDAIPRLGAVAGWNAHFGRELNATDDREAFVPYDGDPVARPVIEGKQIEPFRISLERSRCQLRPDCEKRIPRRVRLAYRDVASATNRLTLIAALVPARAVTTHTLFCLKTPLSAAEQQVLCALLNSYVANYLIRMRVNTHVTAALMSRLPVPVVRPGAPAFDRLHALAAAIARSSTPVEEMEEYAELQSIAARLYGLTADDFAHVLETFPLVPRQTKFRSLARATETRRHGGSHAPRCR